MSQLENALRAHRTALNERERETRRRMRLAYQNAIAGLSDDLRAAQQRIAEIRAAGEEVPTWRLLNEARIRQLLANAEMQFTRFGETVRADVIREQQEAVRQAQADAVEAMRAGMGAPPAGIAPPVAILPTAAISELVGALRPDSPLSAILDRFGPEAATTVRKELLAGMAAGTNSRAIAKNIKDALGGNLARANLIARTETHRAYRGATLQTYQANKHLLKGWEWSAARDRRTCPVCLALDGRLFDVDTPMRAHPACRCSMRPKTKTWKELGYDVPEPMVRRENGRDWFQRQSVAVKRDILGPAAQAAYDAGELDLDDFVRLKRSRVWGSSYTRASLEAARANAAKRERRAA